MLNRAHHYIRGSVGRYQTQQATIVGSVGIHTRLRISWYAEVRGSIPVGANFHIRICGGRFLNEQVSILGGAGVQAKTSKSVY